MALQSLSFQKAKHSLSVIYYSVLNKQEIERNPEAIEMLTAIFDIPSYFWLEHHRGVNGSFGCREVMRKIYG
jgi:hypothetical protein